MSRENGDLKVRTKSFALRIVKMYCFLSESPLKDVLGRQVLKSGTSVGAHYREACRARSTKEFISKMEGGLQELDETAYWLDLLAESGIVKAELMGCLQKEAEELTAIFTASVKTAKQNRRKKKG